MKILAHAHGSGTGNRSMGLVVLLERNIGPVWDYQKNKAVTQFVYYVVWGGIPRVRDGNAFRKTKKGGFSYFKKKGMKL